MRTNKVAFTKVAIWLVCHRLSIKIIMFFDGKIEKEEKISVILNNNKP